ncbi:rhodanese-like domain-containing protein [Lutimonas sp.]|uniref:rhodanese-like domain-containing protein n=1 Tax=Lutimonas sp. TaxID=1872403 RepID=UPI003D9AEE47
MRKLSIILVLLILPASILVSSFKTPSTSTINNTNPPSEFETLLNYLETNRDFINTDAAPALIPADEVKKNLKNPKYLLIDIRSASWFEYGHIKNATNVQPSDLLNHFEKSIVPSEFDKIILICYSGQSAAYFTSLLRIAGYDNTYSMNWGMSSWRVDFAENSWLKNTSDDFSSKLEQTTHDKATKGDRPEVTTGNTDAEAILRARLEIAFATPYKESIVKSSNVFESPNDFYIVDYNGAERYAKGHIPNAKQYDPQGSLRSSADLFTLPTNKKVLVYGPTGQETAYVVAYLNVLGYQAGNLAYGGNSFMHKQLKDNDWESFSKKEVNMYPVIE